MIEKPDGLFIALQSALEEKVVRLRYDLEAFRDGEQGPDHGRQRKISPEEWDDRLRSQGPAGFALLALIASASFLKGH